jgi:hypothetical protein
MSENHRRPRGDSMPTIMWLLIGILVIALFVLVLGMLHPGS